MRLKSLFSSLLAAAAVLVASAPDAQASHFRYGTLSWAPTAAARQGNSFAVGEVRFDLRVAFRRDGLSGTAPDGRPQTGDIFEDNIGSTWFIFGDTTATPSRLRFIVTDFSVAENWVIAQALNPGTNTPGIEHTYSGAGPFTARLGNSPTSDACCRLGAADLNNRANGSYPLQTIVRPFDSNRSPVSNLVPIVIVPESPTATFLVPASDPDGDPVRWRLADAGEAGSTGSGGPLHPSGLTINPNTGIVTWNNMGLNRTRFWTTQVVIEDLDAQGNVKSKTPVDFLLKIVVQQGTQPSCALNPPGPFTVIPGTLVAFALTGTDADPGDQIILNASGVPPGATMTPALPTSGPTGVTSNFAWTPTAADEGTTVISFSATDTFGNQGLCNAQITVEVNTAPTISCAPDVKVECSGPGGSSHTLTTHVADPDGDALTVTWRVDGAVVEIDNVPANPNGPTSADVTMTHTYAVGSHVVEVTVSDGQAAALSCTTNVVVSDTTAPVVTCTVGESMLWPPNHNMVNVGLLATSSDACNPTGGTAVVRVFGDEDDEDPTGDGTFSPDAKNIASGTLRLRSEREGDKDGRVYLMIATATDGSGNTGWSCCTVTVPLSKSFAHRDLVLSQAAVALDYCQTNGAAPADYVVVGDGPPIGPDRGFSEGSPARSSPAVRGTSKSSGVKRRRQ